MNCAYELVVCAAIGHVKPQPRSIRNTQANKRFSERIGFPFNIQLLEVMLDARNHPLEKESQAVFGLFVVGLWQI